jgi:hypothetical protein
MTNWLETLRPIVPAPSPSAWDIPQYAADLLAVTNAECVIFPDFAAINYAPFGWLLIENYVSHAHYPRTDDSPTEERAGYAARIDIEVATFSCLARPTYALYVNNLRARQRQRYEKLLADYNGDDDAEAWAEQYTGPPMPPVDIAQIRCFAYHGLSRPWPCDPLAHAKRCDMVNVLLNGLRAEHNRTSAVAKVAAGAGRAAATAAYPLSPRLTHRYAEFIDYVEWLAAQQPEKCRVLTDLFAAIRAEYGRDLAPFWVKVDGYLNGQLEPEDYLAAGYAAAYRVFRRQIAAGIDTKKGSR